ncbi:hypothetical protein FNYG_14098 [Fusarium nygamai]|uniref:Uncharacterized protein n=1 Tax=Gibberella nygamai TaxID=42673 RepID=A0A2K0UTS9_GIBNY|nr:hypothetical protein FNYG_14098 [Fusarium nygamai]
MDPFEVDLAPASPTNHANTCAVTTKAAAGYKEDSIGVLSICISTE